ncbi:MAG TPA: aminotransferase class IV [Chitinophagaceae bacterium]|nr:aminotransferase class IV [Chitinophagaceae bacterium]
MNYVIVDGNLVTEDKPALQVNNRGYRYGDGLFETMLVLAGKIIFETYHFERLFEGLKLIQIELPPAINPKKLAGESLKLCEQNNCTELARVRLSVNSGNGNLSDPNNPQYIIECQPIKKRSWNETGLLVDVYPSARKTCDRFSHLKSANYLPYVMAARYASKNQLDDALVLNAHERIAESSIANVFVVKDGRLFTPSLQEGCVSGTVRRWILENYDVVEKGLTPEDVKSADEVFLSNAISGIRWVRQCGDAKYYAKLSLDIYQKLQRESG